jgi:succinylarginine dihydrolase
MNMRNKAGIVLCVLLSVFSLAAANRGDYTNQALAANMDAHDPILFDWDDAFISRPSLAEQVREKLGGFIAARINQGQDVTALQNICSDLSAASIDLNSAVVQFLRNNLSSGEMAQIDLILNRSSE